MIPRDVCYEILALTSHLVSTRNMIWPNLNVIQRKRTAHTLLVQGFQAQK